MPLYKSIPFNTKTQILIWKITETLEELLDQVKLSDSALLKLSLLKTPEHKLGFLSVRKLLQECHYSDHDIFYDEFGKPHLKDGTHISISHSHEWSAIIISDKQTGIDLEMRRDKIAVIANKFIEPGSQIDKDASDYISKLTVNWGIKEAVFKIRNEKGISFKDHINVAPFEMENKQTTATLHFNNLKRNFDVYFEELENYTLVYIFEK
ncbi:MAG TPA: hypothetical protein VK623_06520 [Flavobacterium sp.]|nr:hypothetical protein [Flavobacterium sp.]